MGLELAKAYIRIQAESSTLGQGLQEAQSQTGNAVAGIQGAIAGITSAVGLAAMAFTTMGVQAAASLEQTVVAFDVMLGSAQETKTTMAALTKFAATTPFEMPEILVAARGLIQFGERGQQLIDTLRFLGNASAGTSSSFGEIAMIFNQVRGVGKLLTQDFRQLSTRGILSLQDIATHFGVTTSAAQDMLSKGKVSFSAFSDILAGLSAAGGRFFNMTEKQATTLTGLLSTLNDVWSILARTMAGPVAESLKPIISGAISLMEKISEMVDVFPGAAAGALVAASAFGTLASGTTAAMVAASLFGTTLSTVFLAGGIAIAALGVAVAIGAITGELTDASVNATRFAERITMIVAALGAAFIAHRAITGAIIAYTAATKAASTASAVFTAIAGGPAGWLKVAASIAAAGAAAYGVHKLFDALESGTTEAGDSIAKSIASAKEEIAALSDEFVPATQRLDEMKAAANSAAEAVDELAKMLGKPFAERIASGEATTGGYGVAAPETMLKGDPFAQYKTLIALQKELASSAGLAFAEAADAVQIVINKLEGYAMAVTMPGPTAPFADALTKAAENAKERLDSLKASLDRLGGAEKGLEGKTKALADLSLPLEDYEKQMQRISDIEAVFGLTMDEKARLMAQATDTLDKALGGPKKKLEEMREQIDYMERGLTKAQIEAEKFSKLHGADADAYRKLQARESELETQMKIEDIFKNMQTDIEDAGMSITGMTDGMIELWRLGAQLEDVQWFAESEARLRRMRKEAAMFSREAGERITDALKTPVEESQEQVTQLQELFRRGYISQETFRRGLVAERRTLGPDLPKGLTTMRSMMDSFTQAQIGMEDMLDPAKTSAEEAQKHTRLLNEINTALNKPKPGGGLI